MVSRKSTTLVKSVLILAGFVCLLAGAFNCQAGLLWGSDPVVTINGEEYMAKDIKTWWKNWQEDGMVFPESPDPYIDWHLLAAEAEKMELYREPSFRHKINVFLKVRSLLQYKFDKINSRVEITDDMIREYYREKYLPRLKLALLYLNEREKARQVESLIAEKKRSLRDYVLARPEEERKSFYFEEKSIRMNKLNSEWQPVVGELAPGEISPPLAWREGYVIIELQEKKGFDPEDFRKQRQNIEIELRKKMEDSLTVKLVEDLRDRYGLEIDWDLFEKINLDSKSEDLLDRTLITLGDQEYSAAVFLDKLRKQQQMETKYGIHIKDQEAFKRKVLNGIISQTVISRASLDEHYEEREPLKPVFEFYYNHRLIKELERRLFREKNEVTDREIKDYYQENREQFSRPATVTIALIQDEEKLVDKMFGEIKRGLSFPEVARKYYAAGVPEEEIPFDRLDSRVKKILNNLAIGEVSEPFELYGRHAFLKLINRTPSSPMPLEHVSKSIVSLLKDRKFEQIRQNYLALLKSRSEISVDETAWNNIKREIGNPDAE